MKVVYRWFQVQYYLVHHHNNGQLSYVDAGIEAWPIGMRVDYYAGGGATVVVSGIATYRSVAILQNLIDVCIDIEDPE